MTIKAILFEFVDQTIKATVTEQTEDQKKAVWAARFNGKEWNVRIILQNHIVGGRYREWNLITSDQQEFYR